MAFGEINMQPIIQAVQGGNLALVKWLLSTNGGELRRRLEMRQMQPQVAIGLGNAGSPEVVEYLCEAQADPNVRFPPVTNVIFKAVFVMMDVKYKFGNKDPMVYWVANCI